MSCTLKFDRVSKRDGRNLYLFKARETPCFDASTTVPFQIHGTKEDNALTDDQLCAILSWMEDEARALFERGESVVSIIEFAHFPSIQAYLESDSPRPPPPGSSPTSFLSVYYTKYQELREWAARKEFPDGFNGMFLVIQNSAIGSAALRGITLE